MFHVWLALFSILRIVDGHAIFWEPPSRASLGKHNRNMCDVPVNDDHNGIWCGGVQVQHGEKGGKCAICGDTYGADDRPHEAPGGKYATGIIGRSYPVPGATIDVAIDVVANHRGFFVFKLCPNNNPDQDPTHDCFEQLQLSDGSDRYMLTASGGVRANIEVVLPAGLECWQCIMQWTYVTGNSWGSGPQTAEIWTQECLEVGPEGKMGCGPQETFRGCADICIGPRCPTEPCQRAKPFTDEVVTTGPSTGGATGAPWPAIADDGSEPLCLQTGVKEQYYSSMGDYYCQVTCLFKPMAQCNLFLCDCTSAAYWNDQRNILS